MYSKKSVGPRMDSHRTAALLDVLVTLIHPHISHTSKFWHKDLITYNNFMVNVEPCMQLAYFYYICLEATTNTKSLPRI